MEASAPLMQQRRGDRLVEFVLIFTICFAITSLLISFEPLARNTVQNHNGQFDLPPRSNHSVGIQSGMDLSSSNNRSVIVEEDLKMSLLQNEYVGNFSDSAVIVAQESDHQDDADNSESDSESCLRPRRNSDAAVESPLKLPCKGINSFDTYGLPILCGTSISQQKTHSCIFVQSSRFFPLIYTSRQFRHAKNGLDLSSQILPMRGIRIHPLDLRKKIILCRLHQKVNTVWFPPILNVQH